MEVASVPPSQFVHLTTQVKTAFFCHTLAIPKTNKGKITVWKK
jgi:hypothetical protein